MAFPFIISSNFEAGTNAEWTSESDGAARLDFPHWRVLAREGMLPYRGAYCMRVRLGSATAAKVIHTSGDIADGGTAYLRFMFYLGQDVKFTADDTIQLVELTQAGAGTCEMALGLRLVAADNTIEIGIGDGLAPTAFAAQKLVRGRWYSVELKALVSTSDVGTMDLYLDGALVASLATLDQAAAVGDVCLGVTGCLTTTTGTVLFDQFVFDDGRIYPIVDRYPTNVFMTKSGHAFVGPGFLENITLLAGAAADNTLDVYDTNTGNTNDANKVGVAIRNVTASDVVDVAGLPVQLKRGCYVSLGGTNPRAVAIVKPYAYSQSALVNMGQNIKGAAPLEG